MPALLYVKKTASLRYAIKSVRRGLVNRDGARAVITLWCIAGMKRYRGGFEKRRIAHIDYFVFGFVLQVYPRHSGGCKARRVSYSRLFG